MRIERTDNYIIVDDWLSKTETEELLEECKRVREIPSNASLFNREGKALGETRKLFYMKLDAIYPYRKLSPMLAVFDTKFRDDGKKIMEGCTNIFKTADHTTFDSTELQIYGDGGYYNQHTDQTNQGEIIVLILMLNREPKKFSGGEFVLGDKTIEHKNGRLVIFPNFISHEVTRVKLDSKDDLDGRISLQHRVWYKNHLSGEPK